MEIISDGLEIIIAVLIGVTFSISSHMLITSLINNNALCALYLSLILLFKFVNSISNS